MICENSDLVCDFVAKQTWAVGGLITPTLQLPEIQYFFRLLTNLQPDLKASMAEQRKPTEEWSSCNSSFVNWMGYYCRAVREELFCTTLILLGKCFVGCWEFFHNYTSTQFLCSVFSTTRYERGPHKGKKKLSKISQPLITVDPLDIGWCPLSLSLWIK